MTLYNFNEAAVIYEGIQESWKDRSVKISTEVFKARSNYLFVLDIWDSYNMPAGMTKPETLVGVLKTRFSNVEACRVCRPLGDFKDFNNASHEEIYNLMVQSFKENRIDARGNFESYVSLLYPYAKKLSGKYNNYTTKTGELKDNDKYFNQNAFEIGLSMMLYRSAIGIHLESYVSNYLEKLINNNGHSFEYRVAPSSMESDDIDGFICDSETGEELVLISIKTLNALTERSIFGTWRAPESKGGKGKTKPQIYIGVSDDEYNANKDTAVYKVSHIKVDDMGLKDLLKAARQKEIVMAA